MLSVIVYSVLGLLAFMFVAEAIDRYRRTTVRRLIDPVKEVMPQDDPILLQLRREQAMVDLARSHAELADFMNGWEFFQAIRSETLGKDAPRIHRPYSPFPIDESEGYE